MKKPRLRVFNVVKIEKEDDGRTYASPVTAPICDFCGDIGPKWSYGCEDFVIVGIPSPWSDGHWASSGEWAACQECSELIDADKRLVLIGRAMSSGRTNREYAEAICAGFFRRMTGTKEAFG